MEKKIPWYYRSWKWGFLRQSAPAQSRIGWRVRAFIVLTLMLIACAKYVLPTQYALTHTTFVWVLLVLATLACFVLRRRWSYYPDRINDADDVVRAIVGKRNESGFRWRFFLIVHLAIALTYAVAATKVGWWAWMVNHQEELRATLYVLCGLIVLGVVGCIGWSVFQDLRNTFGRREPYVQAIWEWKRALDDERRAHAQLREVVPMVGQCLATGIVRIRLGKGKPQAEQNRLLVDARVVLQNALGVLVTDKTTRDAMLERARRTAEGEDESQPSTATPSPTA